MENIDTEYAGILHGNQLNPYSQCLIRENGKNIWCIKTLTEEAYEQIIQPMSEVKSVVFKKSGRDVGVTKWQMDRCEERELLDEFYDRSQHNYTVSTADNPFPYGKNQYYGICGEYQYSCTWPGDAGQICAVIVEIWRIFRCGYQDRHGNGGHAI